MAAKHGGPVKKAPGSPAPKSNPNATAWAADSTYQAQRNALKTQLDQYGANLATQASRYDQQYGEDLGNLGLQNAHGHRFVSPDNGIYGYKDSIATDKKSAQDTYKGGLTTPKAATGTFANWNQIDPLTASGKAFTDQNNDYAARGMLQSTGYLTDRTNLGQNFTNQLNDANLARTNYLHDLNAQNQAYLGQTNDNIRQAQMQAMANLSAQQQTNAVRAAAGLGKTG